MIQIRLKLETSGGKNRNERLDVKKVDLAVQVNIPKRTSNSSSSSVAEPNDGVAVEMLVRGNEELVYYVEGKEVLRYSKPQLDPKSKEAKSLVAKGASLDLSFGHIARAPSRRATSLVPQY